MQGAAVAGPRSGCRYYGSGGTNLAHVKTPWLGGRSVWRLIGAKASAEPLHDFYQPSAPIPPDFPADGILAVGYPLLLQHNAA